MKLRIPLNMTFCFVCVCAHRDTYACMIWGVDLLEIRQIFSESAIRFEMENNCISILPFSQKKIR